MRRRAVSFAVLSALTSSLILAASAAASFHENLIREVHEGPASNGDYVELQARSAGQNFVAGKHIVTYDAGGGQLTNFTIPGSVSNGANQATILIANTASVSGVTADFNAGTDLNVDNTGGTVCFTDSSITIKIDCVAFDHPGDLNPFKLPTGASFGSPFILPGANLDGKSLIRTISGGCATALDAADDTNSAADFTVGNGSPRNNSATPSETPCPPSTPAKKKCKKHKKKTGAYSAKKKKCKKKKHH